MTAIAFPQSRALAGPRTDQRYLLAVWITIGVLTPILGFLGARGFAPGVGLVGLLSIRYARPQQADWPGLGLLGLLAAWAALSAVWSPAPNLSVYGVKDFERLTPVHLFIQLVLAGSFVVASGRLDPETAERALRWLGYGLTALGAILVVEGLGQAAIYQRLQGLIHQSVRPDLAVRNVAVGGYVMAALVWPVGMALLRQKRILTVVFLIATVIFSTFVLRGDSPSVAIVLSALVFLAVRRWGRWSVLALTGITSVYWLGAPWAAIGLQVGGLFDRLHMYLPPSWARRLEIWTFTGDKWMEHPVRGWGLDASRTFKGDIQLHPHDGALQVWLELGWPGAVLMAGFWAYLFWRTLGAVDEERDFTAAACATATVYLVIGAISFGLWQEWWIALGGLALASCVALRQLKIQPPPRSIATPGAA